MRAWIENDDDITPFIEIDVYDENGVMIEAHGIQCRDDFAKRRETRGSR